MFSYFPRQSTSPPQRSQPSELIVGVPLPNGIPAVYIAQAFEDDDMEGEDVDEVEDDEGVINLL